MAKIAKHLSNFLKAEDVKAGPILITIDRIEEQLLGDDTKEKLIVHPEDEAVPPFVLNKTNIIRMQEMFPAEDTDEWVGKQIVLYFDAAVTFGGKKVGGIGVRSKKDGGKKAKPAPVEDSEDY